MTVTIAYAALSIRAGILCSAADLHLGGYFFTMRGRLHAWDLTEELLETWRQEAIALGVPDEKLQPTPEELDDFPRLIEAGIAVQDRIDRDRQNVN